MVVVLFLFLSAISVGSIRAIGECPGTPPSRIAVPSTPPKLASREATIRTLKRKRDGMSGSAEVQMDRDPLVEALVAHRESKVRCTLFKKQIEEQRRKEEAKTLPRCGASMIIGGLQPGRDGDGPTGQGPLSI